MARRPRRRKRNGGGRGTRPVPRALLVEQAASAALLSENDQELATGTDDVVPLPAPTVCTDTTPSADSGEQDQETRPVQASGRTRRRAGLQRQRQEDDPVRAARIEAAIASGLTVVTSATSTTTTVPATTPTTERIRTKRRPGRGAPPPETDDDLPDM